MLKITNGTNLRSDAGAKRYDIEKYIKVNGKVKRVTVSSNFEEALNYARRERAMIDDGDRLRESLRTNIQYRNKALERL